MKKSMVLKSQNHCNTAVLRPCNQESNQESNQVVIKLSIKGTKKFRKNSVKTAQKRTLHTNGKIDAPREKVKKSMVLKLQKYSNPLPILHFLQNQNEIFLF